MLREVLEGETIHNFPHLQYLNCITFQNAAQTSSGGISPGARLRQGQTYCHEGVQRAQASKAWQPGDPESKPGTSQSQHQHQLPTDRLKPDKNV